ncbi:MAG: FG-GAP repeat domain-containing protein [Bryobacteraceae bacterium]
MKPSATTWWDRLQPAGFSPRLAPTLAAVWPIYLLLGIPLVLFAPEGQPGPAWRRHVIDASLSGPLAARFGSVGREGLRDLVGVWRQDGAIRLYRNPGPKSSRDPWPAVTIGFSLGAIDAVFADIDSDGIIEIVTPCQSGLILFHKTAGKDHYFDAESWHTDILPDAPRIEWTSVAAANVDDRYGWELFAGGRAKDARLGWFESLAQPGDVAGFRWHTIAQAGWISAILAYDMDIDGDLDLLAADRLQQGVAWYENPGAATAYSQQWARHPVSATPIAATHVSLFDLDGDGLLDVISAAKPNLIWFHRRRAEHARSWQSYPIRLPESSGSARSVKAADVNVDGKMDLVVTTEESGGRVMWLSYLRSLMEDQWREHNISGPESGDFGDLELIDLDGDGDLDVLTTESKLGIIWYENPTRQPAR